jgi:hypothetical protein
MSQNNYDIEKMNKRVEPDPLTGDFQTVYWNDEHTFMMCIPHKAILLPKGVKPSRGQDNKNEDGSTTFELIKE